MTSTSTDSATRVGTLAWSSRTSGQLSSAERRQLLGPLARAHVSNAFGRTAMLLRLGSSRRAVVPARALLHPSSVLTRAAEEQAQQRLSPALLNHAYRCYLFGVALASLEQVDVDRELLFTAAMLHDIGLANPVRNVDFTVASARVAQEVAEAVGLSVAATEVVGTAITMHHSPDVTLADGPVAYLMSAGAALDVTGLRSWRLPPDLLRSVAAERPRRGFTHEFRRLWADQAEAVPRGRARLLQRYGPSSWPSSSLRSGTDESTEPGQMTGASTTERTHHHRHTSSREKPVMSTTDLRPSRPSGAPASTPADRRGPLGRIVVASLVTGTLVSGLLVLVAFPGAAEHVTTGVALLGFALGWSMLAFLSSRMTSSPQRWAYGLAAFLGASGTALLTVAPGDDALSAAAWVWPPALLVLLVWSARRAHTSLPGRSRWLLYPVLGVLAVSSFGALAQNVGVQREAGSMAMPGRLFDVGGHRLHLSCTGTGSPTVVLESGLGGSSPLWGRISAATAGATRVCSYDRAGTGWSDSARGAHDSVAVATDLHRLLTVAGEHGPYVLVGHSTGGVYAMTYAARYPEQVAGMVLLDSASPRQFTVLPDYASQYPMMTRLYAVRPALYRLGVGRLVPALSSNEVPGSAGTQAAGFAVSPRDARAARDELAAYRRAFAQAQELSTLGSKPLIVVSASETLSGTAGWSVAQQQLVALSANGSQRVVSSSHAGLLDHAGSHQASAAAIADVVHAVRTGLSVRVP